MLGHGEWLLARWFPLGPAINGPVAERFVGPFLVCGAWEVSMEANKSCLERAFEIARSGKVPNLLYLLNQLKSEGYGHDQIYGPVLKKQLSDLIEKAKAS
jgi:hypothetical protein